MKKIIRLDEILKEKNIKQTELAEAIERTTVMVNQFVKGYTLPKSPQTLLDISEFLDVDVRELFIPTRETVSETLYVIRGGGFVPVGELNK